MPTVPIFLSERSKQVLILAQKEAYLRGQSMVQPNHLRLALLGYFDLPNYLQLAAEGFSLEELAEALEEIEEQLPRRTTRIPIPEMYLSPDTLTILERASRLLRAKGQLYLTPKILFYSLFEKERVN